MPESRLIRKLVLPLPENRANARWHWTKENSLKHSFYLRATAAEMWRPPTPYESLIVEATLFLFNPMDEDNMSARMKWPLDWLQRREIVGDDKNVKLRMSQAIDRKNQRLEMTLYRND